MAETYNSEDEVRQFKTWIKENGFSLVAGLGVGLLVVLGWQGWQSWDKHRSEQASQRYAQLQMAVRADNLVSAETYVQELRDDYKSTPYAALGALQVAGGYARKDQLPQADEHLKWVISYAADDKLRNLARLRRARLLWAQGNPEEALKVLEKHSAGEALLPLLAELRGDLLQALGRRDEAVKAYTQARNSHASPAERALVEQKLDDLAVVSADQAASQPAEEGVEASQDESDAEAG